MTKDEKVAALSDLKNQGILTADELSRVVAALGTETVREKSLAEIIYETYIKERVATTFKNPASVKYPPFDPAMVKAGTIKLDLKEQNVRYIETYVEVRSTNGTMLREEIIIGIDEYFNPLFWAQHTQNSPLLGKSKSWMSMGRA